MITKEGVIKTSIIRNLVPPTGSTEETAFAWAPERREWVFFFISHGGHDWEELRRQHSFPKRTLCLSKQTDGFNEYKFSFQPRNLILRETGESRDVPMWRGLD